MTTEILVVLGWIFIYCLAGNRSWSSRSVQDTSTESVSQIDVSSTDSGQRAKNEST